MFSESFKINVNKNASEEMLLILIRVSHPTLTIPICLVKDTKKVIFEGDEYIPFPMKIKMDNQVQGELPKATIVIPNFAKQIVKWIDSTMGAKNGLIEVIITRRSSLEKEYAVLFEIMEVNISHSTVSFSVAVQNNLNKPSIRWVYSPKRARGLF